MSSAATTSVENQQGNGRLKLKIKFSRSKGFVSDFVNEGAADVRKQLCTTVCEPTSEHVSSLHHTEAPSEYRLHEVSSSQHVDDASDQFQASNKSGDLHQGLSNDGTSSCAKFYFRSDVDKQGVKESASCLKEGKAVSHSTHPAADSTGFSAEIHDPHPILCDDSTKTDKRFCGKADAKQADLSGVNYGKVLQDLEFLSAQQDEPDGRDASPACRQKEQHINLVNSTTQPQMYQSTMMESVVEGKASTVDTPSREEASDGEPMSPFDINCSLGFADEDFTFTAPAPNPAAKHKVVKENPLFPWSVDVVAKSDSPCAQTVSVLNSENRPSRDDIVMHAGGLADVQHNSSDQCIKPSFEQTYSHGSLQMDWRNSGADRAKQRIVNFGNSSGSSLGSEINNNVHYSNSLLGSGPHLQRRTPLVPHAVGFVSAAARTEASGVNLSSIPVAGSTCTSSISTESENRVSWTRALPSDCAVNNQHQLSSSTDRDVSGLASIVLQQSSSVFCQRPSGDSAIAEKTDTQTTSSSSSHHPSVQHSPSKDGDGKEADGDFVIELLSSTDSATNAAHSSRSSGEDSSLSGDVMNQLAENPPSVEPLATPLTSETAQTPAAVSTSGSVTCTMSNPLNRTIDELRKRVGEKGMPNDCPDTAAERRSPSLNCSSESHIASSANAKRKEQRKASGLCTCPKQELSFFPKSQVTDGNKTKDKFCRRCGKRTKAKRKMDFVWCRCDSPDPFLPDGTISELCRKCMKRVGKLWRKQKANKWCKCHTPVLCTFTSTSSQGVNGTDKFYVCKRCQKWISKDREDICMKGDRFGVLPGESALPPTGLQSLMTDHNYCQFVASPNAQPKPPVPPGTPVVLPAAPRQPSVLLQGNNICGLLIPSTAAVPSTSKTIVYVYPHKAVVNPSGSSVKKGCTSSNGPNHSDVLTTPAVTSTSAAQSLDNSICALPASADQPSLGSVPSSGNLQNGNVASGLSASCGDYPSLRAILSESPNVTAPGKAKSGSRNSPTVTAPGKAKSGSRNRRKRPTQIRHPCPAWLNGISRDLLQPSYVVMEKIDGASLSEHTGADPGGPCTVSCRQNSLKEKCRQGDLPQCGHSLESERLSDGGLVVSGLQKKRAYFRKHKTMVGFEETIEKERVKRLKRLSALKGVNNVQSQNFCPLSSEHQPGFTNVRITSNNGVQIQCLSENFMHPFHTFQQHSAEQQGTTENENTTNRPAVQSVFVDNFSAGTEETNSGTNRNPSRYPQSSNMHSEKHGQAPRNQESRNVWSKKTRFRVKYYVFGAQDRAFIVPLIQNRRHSKAEMQLDQEDMGYVKETISLLLAEENSCARHLTYPDSLQHKGSKETVSQCTNKKTFVAPTLGGEDLDIDGLKSLISDGDFSRLVPRNTRISKSKYLQEIGEKVHMYLTGGCEETPDWIKDVAKSIVMKHRKNVKGKKKKTRLKPSKDVSIEIDYAEEEEMLDVGDEEMMSPSHSSVTDGDLSTAGLGVTFESETTDQCNKLVPDQPSEADQTSNPTGSYVVAEAFLQEEKKPLLQSITGTLQQSSVSSADGGVPAPGQQILVPLPDSCSYGQPEANLMSQSGSASPLVQQHGARESSVTGEQQDHKPLLGELLAAALLPGPTSTERSDNNNDDGHNEHMQEQHSTMTSEPSPAIPQFPTWPLPYVKQEPPDEDFSHAWSNQSQPEDVGQSSSTHPNQGRLDSIPFISNSTFGREAVQIEDEEGSTAPHRGHLPCSVPEVRPVIKVEQPDGESERIGIPVITYVAPGELGVALTNSDQPTAPDVKENILQSFSVACTETDVCDTGSHAHGIVEVAACKDQATTDEIPPQGSCQNEEKTIAGFGAHTDTLTSGECIDSSVENQILRLIKDGETVNPSEQTQVIIMPESTDLPLISAVASGEAAKIWEAGNDRLSADSQEMSEPSDSTSSSQPGLPVITSVMCGEAVVYEDDDAASFFHYEMENENEQQTDQPEDDNDDYSEDFPGEEDYFEEEDHESGTKPIMTDQGYGGESDLKPIISGEGQVLAIPMILPSESTLPEARDQHAPHIPQIGVDLSIVKQEPEEVVDFSVAFMDDSQCVQNHEVVPGCSVVMSNDEENIHSVVDESLPVPSILEVRSLASIPLPSEQEEETEHMPLAAEEENDDVPSHGEGEEDERSDRQEEKEDVLLDKDEPSDKGEEKENMPSDKNKPLHKGEEKEDVLLNKEEEKGDVPSDKEKEGGYRLSDREADTVDTSGASGKSENQSITTDLVLQAEFPESPNSPESPFSHPNDSSSSESVVPDINTDLSKMTEEEVDEDIEHLTDEVRSSLKTNQTSGLKSASAKGRCKKGNKKLSGKKKRQEKGEVKSIVDLPDFLQDPHEKENSSVCENVVSAPQNLDSFTPPKLPPSSLATGGDSSPVRKKEMKHRLESLSSGLKSVQATSSTASGVILKTPRVVISDVMTSDRKSAENNIFDNDSIVSVSDVPSADESFSMHKCSSPDVDVETVEDFPEPEISETHKSCADTLKTNSDIDLNVSSNGGLSNSTTQVGEANSSPEGMNVEDSQPMDTDKGPKGEKTQVLCETATKSAHISEGTPNLNSVSAINSAFHVLPPTTFCLRQKSSKIALSTDQSHSQNRDPAVAETVQKDGLLPLMPEDQAESSSSLRKSPVQVLADHELHQSHFEDNQTTPTDHIHPHHEKSIIYSQQTEHTETNGIIKNSLYNEKCNASSRKQKRKGSSKSKGKKKKVSNSGKMAVCSSTSVLAFTSLSPTTAGTNSQDTEFTVNDSSLSNHPSSQTISNEKDVSVLPQRITRSSVSSIKCLSENQVSSSCDSPAMFQKSDFLSGDYDTPKNTEKKTADLSSKLSSKLDSRSSHHLLQDDSKAAEYCASPDRSDKIDESDHYVAQICERRGEQGRTCLVLRKKRPASSITGTHLRESNVTGGVHEQLKEKDSPVPSKKCKEDITCKPLLSKTNPEGESDSTLSRGLKHKSDYLNEDSHKNSKSSKSQRSIFSDFSAVISSMRACSPESAPATAASKSYPKTETAATKPVSEAVTKATEKAFNKNLFSRLRASLVSVKDSVTAQKDEDVESKALGSVSTSGASAQSARERSFFDCLPQSLLDAWEKK